MIWSDWVCIIIIGLMSIRVAIRGFLCEFSSRSGVIVGLMASGLFHTPLISFIVSRWAIGTTYASLISWCMLFVAGYLSARYLLTALDEAFALLHLGVFDHVLGLALGAAEGAAICIVLIYLLSIQPAVDLTDAYVQSTIVYRLYSLLPGIIGVVKSAIGSGQAGS